MTPDPFIAELDYRLKYARKFLKLYDDIIRIWKYANDEFEQKTFILLWAESRLNSYTQEIDWLETQKKWLLSGVIHSKNGRKPRNFSA
jgi:hypothetical protein